MQTPIATDETAAQQKKDNASANQQALAIQCELNKIQLDDFQRMLAALKEQYQDTDNVTFVTNSGQSQQIKGDATKQPDVKYNQAVIGDKPVITIDVNPALYTASGVVDQDKRIELTAEAGAKLLIAQASAKYPNDKEKGLNELRTMSMFWSGGTPEERGKLDAKTKEKISLLLGPIKTAADQLQTGREAESNVTPSITSSAPETTPAPTAVVGSPASSSCVAKKLAQHAAEVSKDQQQLGELSPPPPTIKNNAGMGAHP